MFDWIQNLAIEAETTGKVVISALAFFVVVWLCHKGGWALARIIISAISIAILLAVLWNLDLFASRFETEIRGGAPVSQPYNPADVGQPVV